MPLFGLGGVFWGGWWWGGRHSFGVFCVVFFFLNVNKYSHILTAHPADEDMSLNSAGGTHLFHPGGAQVRT